ncbi:MAG: arginine--tRNA ligase [Clostridia bacterium]|nr:arginine--tRNA ligase [Clostridia bacterium]
MGYKVHYIKHIAGMLNLEGMDTKDVAEMICCPPDSSMGDFALPCFKLAKTMHKSPAAIAEEIASNFKCDHVVKGVAAVNGYVNFTIDREWLAHQVLNMVVSYGSCFGASDEGYGRTICIDYSSVNIAKPFHIGHLSSTVIGGALYRIYDFLGYKVVGINHLGDYGTQFGKLICAYKHWGVKEEVEKGGIHAVNDLYVRFNSEATEEMEAEAREYFRLIESGDKEANELFDWFKSMTLEYVDRIYARLHVRFDSYNGERFYSDKMQPVIDRLEEKGLLKESDGAKIVDLEEYGMSPCLILRSDGASLYATRDLAAALYRKNTYDFEKCLYVVAYQQNLHFQQIFKVLELMGYDWAKDMVHVAFGMVSMEDGSMSTRQGRVVWLEDVIDKCVEKAYDVINEKNPNLISKKWTAEQVGVGAVIFGALYNARIKDITFSYDKVLSFEGETSVYVQYTCARANSVLEKGDAHELYEKFAKKVKKTGKPVWLNPGDFPWVTADSLEPSEYELIKLLGDFSDVVKEAAEKYEPSCVARYAVELSQKFNKFYIDCKILSAPEKTTRMFRLTLTWSVHRVLKNAMYLLGIEVPDEM